MPDDMFARAIDAMLVAAILAGKALVALWAV